MKILFYYALCAATIACAQNKIPFASQNNTIELAVANSASIDAEHVMVEIIDPPQWVKFTEQRSVIQNLPSQEVSTAHFNFSIDKSAPVGKDYHLHFVVSSSTGERWTKDITIQVSAPEQFELNQNYPNPFNPTTTISYQLPVNGAVSLKVFDILGKEVVTLEEGLKVAGFHQKEWNASGAASGMYIVQMSYKSSKGEDKFQRMKMLLTK